MFKLNFLSTHKLPLPPPPVQLPVSNTHLTVSIQPQYSFKGFLTMTTTQHHNFLPTPHYRYNHTLHRSPDYDCNHHFFLLNGLTTITPHSCAITNLSPSSVYSVFKGEGGVGRMEGNICVREILGFFYEWGFWVSSVGELVGGVRGNYMV